MRIGYVWQYEAGDLSPVSATALHVKAVVQALQRRGHSVQMLTVRQGQAVVSQDLENWTALVPGVDLDHPGMVERGVRSVQSRLQLPYLRYFASRRFSRAARMAFEGFDVLYERFWFSGYGGLLAANSLDIPMVYEINGDLVEEYAQLGIELSSTQWTAIHRITRWMFRRAARVVAVSEVLRQRILERWVADPAKVTTVPNGARVNLFGQARDSREVAQRYGLEDRPAVIFVGSFKPWHGLDVLVEAFSRLSASRPQECLVFVGDGPQRAALEAQVRALGLGERVIFTGAVPHEDVAALLGFAQVAVVNPRISPASLSQSPLKLFEYMAAGKAIVAPDTANLRAILSHRITGLLFHPDDPRALAEALEELLEREDLRRSLGLAAQRQALAEYSWDATAEKLEAIFLAEVRQKV